MAFNFLKKFFTNAITEAPAPAGAKVSQRDFLDNPESSDVVSVETFLQSMAYWTIVRKIGAAVAAVEWDTYRKFKKVKGRESWAWNFEPNPNQTKVEFFLQLVGSLYQNNEAIIVEWGGNGYRYVADSFAKDLSLQGDKFSGVVIHEQQIDRTYSSKDVLHLSLQGRGVLEVLGGIVGAEGKLIKSASNSYIRNQGTHGVLRVSDLAEADADFEETYTDLVNTKLRKYFTAENAVLPLFNGYDFTEHESTGGSTKSSLSGTRDIRSLYDDVVEYVAQAMGVPLSIVTGKQITKEDFDQFVVHCVKPIVEMLADEINRKLYGQDRVQNGAYIAPNYEHIRHRDLFDIADPIDKLIGSGAFSINDIRLALGMEPIDEDWAKEHWMTKNYAPAQEVLNGLVKSDGKEEETDE